MALLARRSLIALVLASLAVHWPTGASASLRAISDDALARSSAAAVQGRVVDVTAAWDADVDSIYTYVTLEVQQAWGLDGSPARVVVKQLGGLVGDTAFVVGGQARFDLGEEVLVFLDVRPRDRTLSVAGLEQGKWLLTGASDPAAAFAREVRGIDQVAVVARDFRAAADLAALAALAGTRVRATGAVLAPAVPAATPAGGDGHAGANFTLLNPSTPARWHQGDTGTPVYVDTQTGGHPQFAGGGLTQLARAAAAWTGVGSLNLQMGVPRGPRCFANAEVDGRLSVTYGDPCGEIADASNTLAIGGAYFTSAGQRVVNGVNYWSIIKGMVITDNVPSKYSWMSTGCYEDMITHELGHAVGFGHTSASGAVMYPSISGTCGSRTTGLPLQADDRAGVAAVYPGAAVPPPAAAPSTPTAFGAVVSGSTVTFNWTPAVTGAAATAFQIQAGSTPGAANYGAANVTGTSLVVPGVANGAYYLRLLAMNAQGLSAPTADSVVAVGPALPGAPRNLTASAGAGGFVTVGWQAPASGGTPASYLLVAGYTPGATTFQAPVAGTSVSGVVPAGSYYLRLVALNGAGAGPASAEVVLTVQ